MALNAMGILLVRNRTTIRTKIARQMYICSMGFPPQRFQFSPSLAHPARIGQGARRTHREIREARARSGDAGLHLSGDGGIVRLCRRCGGRIPALARRRISGSSRASMAEAAMTLDA